MLTQPKKILTLSFSTLLFSPITNAVDLGKFGDTSVSAGGYVKFDAIASHYSDGTIAAGSIGRDFYIPSLTPVGGESANNTIDMHARQTRFNIGTKSTVDGHTIKTFIELGFLATAGGNERVTNSYSPRLRHATITFDNWLFGQTWSTFQNVSSIPETVDFIGNTDAGIFVRQSLVRYTAGSFQFALENPETTVTPYRGGDRIVTDQNSLPDFVGRYNFSSDNFSLSTAVLARQLAYNDSANIDTTTTSFGLSVTGKIKFGRDDLRFGVNTGSGMGRYIGLNVANGAVLDENNELEAIDSTGGFFAYRHFWSEKWRSNISYAGITIDNETDLTETGVTKTSQSLRLNVFYSPVKKLSIGGEVAYATRELESDEDGSMTRLQFSAKLSF